MIQRLSSNREPPHLDETETDTDSSDFTVKTKILLMRHPQTEGNVLNLYQGQSDSPLSELGHRQRARAIDGLVSWQPDALLSSPLARCLTIADSVGSTIGLAVERDNRLQEISFGALEGMSYTQAQALGLSFFWEVELDQQPVEGAESLVQFVARVADAADDLIKRRGRIAVVTHGGVIRAMICHWLGISPERFWTVSVLNVHSTCFSVDNEGTIYFDGFGLNPESLAAL
jgi:broad specificity phosphatase PhoE